MIPAYVVFLAYGMLEHNFVIGEIMERSAKEI